MLGAPVTGSADEWRPLQRVVSGRIVNGYSRSSSGSYVHPYLHTHTRLMALCPEQKRSSEQSMVIAKVLR